MFDVKEISKRLGVSKKTVYKYFKKYDDVLKEYLSIGNKYQKVLNNKGYNLLVRLIEQPTEEKNKSGQDHDNKDNRYIELLESQIKDLKADKEKLYSANEKLHQELDQQQQLHLQLQNNIKLLEVNVDTHKQEEQVDDTATAEQGNEPKGLLDRLKGFFVSK
jgi:AcrR family transcriptional regulator